MSVIEHLKTICLAQGKGVCVQMRTSQAGTNPRGTNPRARLTTDAIVVGIDVGSTTVKAVVVDPASKEILWSHYERHETRQAEKVLSQLVAIGDAFADILQQNIRVFCTGSGAGPLREPLGAKFVQEVNAVTMAVDHLHPDAGSVIELGGQDAKIIIYKDGKEGDRRAVASMNDKCASGTGATIDKCIIKVGMDAAAMGSLPWEPDKIHHVAAKCGVFAETDIVNLVKSGIPSPEIMCSLANAIVMQNLSVLTRGNSLRHKVLLLGGPNTYLPFLRACWRQRIPETWQSRGYDYPRDQPIEELIFAPDNASYYAAYGAVLYGLHEPKSVGAYRGLSDLKAFINGGRTAHLSESAGPPLTANSDERDAFIAKYKVPPFTPAVFTQGTTVRGYVGLDGGSTSSKAVLIDEDGELLCKQYVLSKGNPIADTKALLDNIKRYVSDQGAHLDVLGFGATGYAADVLQESLGADVNIVETVAHMMAAKRFFGDDIDVICDVGGQDIKVLFMVNGDIRNFRLSNQCSAGNGMLLQAMADQFGVDVKEYANTAFSAQLSPNFSYGCAVFLDADRVNFQKEGYSKEELLAGLALVLPKNIWQYVVQIPRMAELGTRYVLQGGTQYNLAAVKSQVDYILARVPDATVHVHPHPGEAGAIGAALETRRVVQRRGTSTFVGLDAAIDIAYTSTTDESTVCHFCPNLCKRTFIDTTTPSGRTSRYISGFSCEKGTVESKEALKTLTNTRKSLKERFPNLVDYEAKLAFRSFYQAQQLPAAGSPIDDIEVRQGMFGRVKRRPVRRGFSRSSDAAQKRRANLRVGIPKVLNIYSSAPLWRTYFETLGFKSRNVVFSDDTSEELWAEGGRYGSIDPCYPSKVAQAHIHNLLFHKHKKEKLDFIFFPCITHMPTFVAGVMESTSCPIVAGAPKVMGAAFTKDVNFFARENIDYVDHAVTLNEGNYLQQQLWEAWGSRLDITRDESDVACREGLEALRLFDEEMQRHGMDILERLEASNDVGLLLLARPYHNDPGLNHDVLEEFQALGYPILSIRSVPKDPAWLKRFFADDLARGVITSPLEVSDVWPENYSTNSVQKVWAAKFAARHPNVVVLDISSFKCGHDAPTYGLIDSIISPSGTPYSALHDLDANKPGGSIKIRVKTYGHTLTLQKERMQDLAARRSELERLVDAKRRELVAARRAASEATSLADPTKRRQREHMRAAYEAYLREDAPLEQVENAEVAAVVSPSSTPRPPGPGVVTGSVIDALKRKSSRRMAASA